MTSGGMKLPHYTRNDAGGHLGTLTYIGRAAHADATVQRAGAKCAAQAPKLQFDFHTVAGLTCPRCHARSVAGQPLSATAFLLAFLSVRPALAANYDYTDAWWVPTESGWGVIFTQSNNFIFATFFIYGQDKKPTWYTAHMTWDGLTKFTGPLYLHAGIVLRADPGIPRTIRTTTQVGTATFTPSTANNYQGTLTYTVTSVGTVTKSIERLPLTPMLLAANYVGGQAGAYSGCTSNSSNRPYQDFYTLQVTQAGSNVSMKFSYTGGSQLVCTLAGTLVQTGQIGGIPSATLSSARTGSTRTRRCTTCGRRRSASKASSPRLTSAAAVARMPVSPRR